MALPALSDIKENLIIDHTTDDALLMTELRAAVSYAEAFQHLPDGYYQSHDMPARTKQGIIMLVALWYESRDAGTGGMFAGTTSAAQQSTLAIDNLLRLDRNWRI